MELAPLSCTRPGPPLAPSEPRPLLAKPPGRTVPCSSSRGCSLGRRCRGDFCATPDSSRTVSSHSVNTSTEGLLCIRHNSRCWTFSREPADQYLCLCGLLSPLPHHTLLGGRAHPYTWFPTSASCKHGQHFPHGVATKPANVTLVALSPFPPWVSLQGRACLVQRLI